MIPDSVVVFALVLLALGLFVWERFSFDVTALIVLGLLLVTGMVTPEEGLSGFANRATVTIAAMFVLTEGLRRTGFLDVVGEALLDAGRGRFRRTLVVLLLTVGVVSAFINNTAAVAIFIPVVIRISGRLQVSPSQLLIPMSFAAMVGGVSTLVGTSTNLLVSSIAEDAGVGAFGMFDFTPVGAAFFAVGLVYLLVVAARLPPRRSPDDLTGSYGVGEYISEVAVAEGSPLAGRTLSEAGLTRGLDLDVLEVLRPTGGRRVAHRRAPGPSRKVAQPKMDSPKTAHGPCPRGGTSSCRPETSCGCGDTPTTSSAFSTGRGCR